MIIAPAFSGDPAGPLASSVFEWEKLTVEKTTSGERRLLIDGHTETLQAFKVHATTLHPGAAPHGSHTHDRMEELIIVMEGLLSVTMGDSTHILGPGSMALASPGVEHGVRNAGKDATTYYIIRWIARHEALEHPENAVPQSTMSAYRQMQYQATEKGGRRQVMRNRTAALHELEMHITTLNEGQKSHDQHTHSDEEIILVLKGQVEELIEDVPHQVGPGSLIFLRSGDRHGIRNVGTGQCEYYAIRWH
jgi:quercetin dioxygenase-like cupin family protein